MLNIRTLILSVVLVVVLILTVPLVAARTEPVSNPSGDAVGAPESKEQSLGLKNNYGPASYRSQFVDCFDVPIKELASCRELGQVPAQADGPTLDECFDVSISELASCRKESQALNP